MPDPLEPFSPGTVSPFVTRAATVSTSLDLLRRIRDSKNGRQGAPQLATPPLVPATLVYVQPSGSIPLWGVVSPTGLLIDPAGTTPADINASRTPGFTVAAPAAVTDAIFILIEPGVAGRLSRAMATGVGVVEVEVTNAAHGYAVPIAGDVFKLTSAESGPARLLSPAGAGTYKTLVQLGAAASAVAVGFFARLTEAGGSGSGGGGFWKFVRLTLNSSGEYVDDGDESDDYSAVPLTIDGTDLAGEPFDGMRVWMIPSKEAGFFEFQPLPWKYRVTCYEGELLWQKSDDNGATWETLEELGVSCDEECDGSGSGENGPLYWIYKTDCEGGYNVRRKAPVYQDPCSMFVNQGPFEFDSYQGCCECDGSGSGSGYNCVDQTCVEVAGDGTFSTLAECEELCSDVVRWDCEDGTCVESETGEYATEAECEAAPCEAAECCVVTEWCLAITGAEGVTYPPETPVELTPLGIGFGWGGSITPASCTGPDSWTLSCFDDGVWNLQGPRSFSEITLVSQTCESPATLVFSAVFACLDSAAVTITLTEKLGDSCAGVTSPCCEGYAIPSTLYLTWSGGTGDYTGFNGVTVTLAYAEAQDNCLGSPLTDSWYGEFDVGPDTYWIELKCTGGVWGLTGSDCNTGVCTAGDGPDTESCNPLLLTGTGLIYSGCFASGNVDWTITETAP